MTEGERTEAAFKRAIAAVETHREMGPYILAQTAPPIYPSRPTAPMPEYLKPEFDDVVRARLTAVQQAIVEGVPLGTTRYMPGGRTVGWTDTLLYKGTEA